MFHHPRRYGKSKYRLERFLRGIFDLLTIIFLGTFQRRPLHLFGSVGLLIGFTGFVINFYLAVLWFSGEFIGDRPLLMLGTLLIIAGIQVVIFGLLAEMITSATYRKSEVMDLVHCIHRSAAAHMPTDKQCLDE